MVSERRLMVRTRPQRCHPRRSPAAARAWVAIANVHAPLPSLLDLVAKLLRGVAKPLCLVANNLDAAANDLDAAANDLDGVANDLDGVANNLCLTLWHVGVVANDLVLPVCHLRVVVKDLDLAVCRLGIVAKDLGLPLWHTSPLRCRLGGMLGPGNLAAKRQPRRVRQGAFWRFSRYGRPSAGTRQGRLDEARPSSPGSACGRG